MSEKCSVAKNWQGHGQWICDFMNRLVKTLDGGGLYGPSLWLWDPGTLHSFLGKNAILAVNYAGPIYSAFAWNCGEEGSRAGNPALNFWHQDHKVIDGFTAELRLQKLHCKCKIFQMEIIWKILTANFFISSQGNMAACWQEAVLCVCYSCIKFAPTKSPSLKIHFIWKCVWVGRGKEPHHMLSVEMPALIFCMACISFRWWMQLLLKWALERYLSMAPMEYS